jgi:hypothetical protein
MKKQIRMASLLLLVLTVSACASNSIAAPAATSQQVTVEDKASLLNALEASGATVEMGEAISQAFFSPEGNIIKVNDADVQVFEYESVEAMENEASQVAPDGGSIGTSMVAWVDVPHFYKAGRIIVLYVGSDEKIIGLLEKTLGPQFAGR